MQSSTLHAGRCLFCTFRAQIAIAQSRRHIRTPLRSFSSTAPSPRNTPAVRYTSRPPDTRRSRDSGSGSGSGSGKPKGKFAKDGLPKQKFSDVLRDRLKLVKEDLKDAPVVAHLSKDDVSFTRIWAAFVSTLSSNASVHFDRGVSDRKKEYQALRDAYYERGINSLDDRIKYAFYDYLTGSRFTESDIRNQKDLADLRYPTEWFPATRAMHRTIHMHVGPTNSGKTYHALQRLEQAQSGVYAGPLRLLAHEIYTRLNAKGKRCTLITGEEKRTPDDTLSSDMQSCTVEMMPLNKTVDVAVIDEIQMIGSPERGWAWTQAVLGVKARELHLCGEARTVPLIRELCASIGEKLHVHEYKRLSPLQMAPESLDGNLKRLRKGDCIVSFSVMGIHALRKQIEKATGRKVATVYGSLPPETRAQQARLFNDPDNDYDYLVASDAIGMGLNLSIKRIIFETSSKWDGFRQRPLAIADIKQIGGRAGRYKSAHQANEEAKTDTSVTAVKGEEEPSGVEASPAGPSQESTSTVAKPSIPLSSSSVGIVTTLEKFDFPSIAKAMKSEPEPIRTAGIFPPAPIVERFASYFPPGTPFSYILMRLHELSQMHSRFHLCGLRDQLWIADLIEPIQGLTPNDRNIMCACPASKSEADLFKRLMPAFARCIETQCGGSLLDIQEMPLEVLDLDVSPSREYLRELERLHKGLVAYLWLSYRFAGIFTTRPLAFHVKALVEEKIEHVLSQFSFTEAQRKKIAAAREKLLLKSMKEENQGQNETGTEVSKNGDYDKPMQPVGSKVESQTSYVAGGDRFSGEEDATIMDPIEDLALDDNGSVNEMQPSAELKEDLAPKGYPSFAQWRTAHTHLRDEDELNWQPTSDSSRVSNEVSRDEEPVGSEEKTTDPQSTDAGKQNASVMPETGLDHAPALLESQVEPPVSQIRTTDASR